MWTLASCMKLTQIKHLGELVRKHLAFDLLETLNHIIQVPNKIKVSKSLNMKRKKKMKIEKSYNERKAHQIISGLWRKLMESKFMFLMLQVTTPLLI